MRTIIEVPDETVQKLDRLGVQHRKSRAAVIREAISLYLSHEDTDAATEAFGLWKEKSVDGLAYQEELRSEWA